MSKLVFAYDQTVFLSPREIIYSMSDISIFDDTFGLALTLLGPLALFLVLGWFFRSAGKRRTAKIFFYFALFYVTLIIILSLIIISGL